MQRAGSHTSIPRFRPDKFTSKTAWDRPIRSLTTGARRAVKKHTHKKQRQLDKKLSGEVDE